MFKSILRFLGMYAPFENIRIAMYRKAGVHIGKVAQFGSNNWLDINFRNMITIEDGVLLAGNDLILSHSFIKTGVTSDEGFSPVIIKKGARIGARVLILAGVTIGEGSVIGAGAVVVKDIPAHCVAVGIPAKPIRYFNQELKSKTAPKLFIVCKTCGVEYWSAIVCDKRVFKTFVLNGNRHPCPHCGAKDRYDKKDYYYKE